MIFPKLGLAITFSQNSLPLLNTAVRLQKLFQSELFLFHVGERTAESECKMNKLLERANLKVEKKHLIWKQGEPSKMILQSTEEFEIDLLIAGALEKENIIKYYIGSVARKIMHEAPCSLLILTNPTTEAKPFQKFCVHVEFTSLCETAIIKSYNFAKLEMAKEFILIKEFEVPGLAMTVYDSGSIKENEKSKEQWQNEEENKLKVFVTELNIPLEKIKTKTLFGKHGWEARNFAELNGSDLFVISSPPKKIKLLDKLFQHDLEFILNELPCSLLIIRK